MAKSKSAKRRNARNRSAQKHAQKRKQRQQSHGHDHLPKVGSPKDDAYVRRRRQADLVDFGQSRYGGRRTVAVVLAILVIMALMGLLLFR